MSCFHSFFLREKIKGIFLNNIASVLGNSTDDSCYLFFTSWHKIYAANLEYKRFYISWILYKRKKSTKVQRKKNWQLEKNIKTHQIDLLYTIFTLPAYVDTIPLFLFKKKITYYFNFQSNSKSCTLKQYETQEFRNVIM